METVGIIALILVVVLTVGYAVRGRRKASPADPNHGASQAQRGGRNDTLDRPADAGAEGMAAPQPGDVNTGPEDRRRA